jgi:hypothetical protein
MKFETELANQVERAKVLVGSCNSLKAQSEKTPGVAIDSKVESRMEELKQVWLQIQLLTYFIETRAAMQEPSPTP